MHVEGDFNAIDCYYVCVLGEYRVPDAHLRVRDVFVISVLVLVLINSM